MRFTEMDSPLNNMRIWAATSGNYTFVISQESEPFTNEEDRKWLGYMASWKNNKRDMRPAIFGGQQPTNRIDGGPWTTFAAAEQACRDTLRQLKGQH